MTKKDFHKSKFDKGTQSKLEVFKEYFKESFPVFLHSPYFEEIFIYDFFAGQGLNSKKEFGTAFNILNEIKPYCKDIRKSTKKVYIILNDKGESDVLKSNVSDFFNSCKTNCQGECVFALNNNLIVKSEDFETYFPKIYPAMLGRKRAAKLLYLDPFKFVIDSDLFNKLINIPSADFISFMPSFFLRRFPDVSAFNKYINTREIDFKKSRPEHCHRVIANYFNTLVPPDKEYYMGCFSIRKDSGYNGLLFGSNHTLGAEKFQKVCWKIDELTGEADYNIDRELTYDKQGVLFEEARIPTKIKQFNTDLENQIIQGKIKTDIDSYKFALKNRCLVKHSADKLKELMKEAKIEEFKITNNDIHKIKIATQIKLK
ncbi:MAG TPA: three-Cys-motif partner protein TcmP [Bacteroidales bacterium]|nr:three-Cys-motif partner protein TcmP [Bacteroidales bacterium]